MMDSYSCYDFGGGLFLSSRTSGLGLGNLDRLTSGPGSGLNAGNSSISSTSSSSRHYDIFSFNRPKLPLRSTVGSSSDLLMTSSGGLSSGSSDEDADSENNVAGGGAPAAQRLPLFRRCPLTNEARLEAPAAAAAMFNGTSSPTRGAGGKMKSSLSLSPLKNLSLNSPIKSRQSATANLSSLLNSVAAAPSTSHASRRYAAGDYDPLQGVVIGGGGGSRMSAPLLNLNSIASGSNNGSSNSRTAMMMNNSYDLSPNNSFSSSTSPQSSCSSYLDSLTSSCNNNNSLLHKTTYSQMARKEPSPSSSSSTSALISPPSVSPPATRPPVQTSYVPPANPKPSKNGIVKPSLEDVKDDSLVAMTNKHGKGKYWFKSGCPTPDPRWPACQQLMIGPIPGDVEYSTLRSAFLSKGHTIHLFIQNNQAWLEKNQEKFGKKQVKFGYVVYTESAVASRLLAQGYVMVGHAKVAVKEMDGQPAQFVN